MLPLLVLKIFLLGLDAVIASVYVFDFITYPDHILNRLGKEALALAAGVLLIFKPVANIDSKNFIFMITFGVVGLMLARECVFMLLSKYIPFGKTSFMLLFSAISVGVLWFLNPVILDEGTTRYLLGAIAGMVLFAVYAFARAVQAHNRNQY